MWLYFAGLRPFGPILFRMLHRACLTDDRDHNLSGVLQFALNSACDIVAYLVGQFVVYALGVYDNPYLTACLNGVSALYAAKPGCDTLKLLQPLYVFFQGLASRTGPACRYGVGGAHKRGEYGFCGDLLVVGGNGVNYFMSFFMPLGEFRPNGRMSALYVAAGRLTDVVEKSTSLGHFYVQLQFTCDKPTELRYLHRVTELVLAVACPVSKSAEELDDLRVHVMEAHLKAHALSNFFYRIVHLLLGLFDYFFNPRRMYAAVGNELLHR